MAFNITSKHHQSMKHPVANITVEGQGWNPHAVAAEGKEAFTARVIADGHYQRGEDGINYTEDERKTLAGTVYDKAAAYVAKHHAHKAEAKHKADGAQGEKGAESVTQPAATVSQPAAKQPKAPDKV